MKKLTMILVVLALLMAFPAAAGAKKPVLNGLTCKQYEEGGLFDNPRLWQVPEPVDGDFELTLNPASPYACLDVGPDKEGEWIIRVSVSGPVTWLQMQVKNSVPGDKCWAEYWQVNRKHSIPIMWPSPLTPAAAEYACGDRVATDTAASLVFMPTYSGAEGSSVTIAVDLP